MPQEYFRTMPDCIDPSDLSFCLRMIRTNSSTGENELILHRHKPGVSGETITDTITFEDPKTFDCAIDQLDERDTVVVRGMGKIRHEHHIWNYAENKDDWFDKTEDEFTKGMITCVLHVKNGILAPCEPKIIKAVV